ncbi:pirin family protein [Peptoniphilus catoniae]|uniref:pirin family protein n=1 Tax=Peptoniphilus catoniae TaxID=1660341 RepID=UPI0010FCEE6B|nr:pirin family protein [Peptoniphilus catoniae]
MKAKILKKLKGQETKDGAGVKLIRILNTSTIESHDPFLMLDSFDSTNYEDYKAGFPTHPHRGIETITYLSKGQVTHKDSMGNEKTIGPKMIQWMTAGSGIMHSEMFAEEDRLLGLQLWLNLPKENKMTHPFYKEVSDKDIPILEEGSTKIKIYSGSLADKEGFKPKYNPLDYFVIEMKKGEKLQFESKVGYTSHLFTLLGEVKVNEDTISEKTDALLSSGSLTIEALSDCELVWMASKPLKEPVAWGGPIVMNTEEELQLAFRELRDGSFIKDKIDE